MKLLFALTLLTLLFANCTKSEIEDNPGICYIEGELLFTPMPLTPLEDLFYSLAKYDDPVSIHYERRIYYKLDNPPFSIDFYNDVITSKDYLKNENTNSIVFETEAGLKFNCSFFEIDEAIVTDWVETRDELGLQRIEEFSPWGMLKIEEGKEFEWIERLQDSPLFKFIQLNHTCITFRDGG